MPRRPRHCPAGMVFHCLNRSVARLKLYENPEDYDAFDQLLEETWARVPVRILGYVVMPDHWHFVLWPQTDTEVSEFLRWLTHTHAMRWHAQHGTVGSGHLYQGRFKSFPVQDDEHLYTVLRYVERNPVHAGLEPLAESWRWGSAWRRYHGKAADRKLLSDWPLCRPPAWRTLVNQVMHESELEAVRRSVRRGCPFGNSSWVLSTAARLGLDFTLRPRGRPRKQSHTARGRDGS